jgi:hypothetical protein
MVAKIQRFFGLTIIILLASVVYAYGPCQDVPDDHPLSLNIERAARIMQKCENFNGEKLINRFDMAIIITGILREANVSIPIPSNRYLFDDLSMLHPAYGAVQVAVATEVLRGFENEFLGDKLINRYQMSVILAKLCGLLEIPPPAHSETDFTDVGKTHWAYKSINLVVAHGLIKGFDNKFHGDKLINRYQVAELINKIFEKLGKY